MDPESIEAKLFHRGAEADLFLSQLGPWKVVIKQRVRKKYRKVELDRRIRKERTAKEASALHEARRAGVRTPTVLALDLDRCSITMSHVSGFLARDQLDTLTPRESSKVFREVGGQVGLLHIGGIVHGDLTTSNIIVTEGNQPFLLDFGMSTYSSEYEDRGVDLHLLRRSIVTSHAIDANLCTKAASRGYQEVVGAKTAKSTFKKEREIARRGRYFAIR